MRKKKVERQEKKTIHPLNINTYDNPYVRLNECDNIKRMLDTNLTGKAPSKVAIS